VQKKKNKAHWKNENGAIKGYSMTVPRQITRGDARKFTTYLFEEGSAGALAETLGVKAT